MFFCRLASGGSASTGLYCKNEKHVQKRYKIECFFDVSNHPNAQVPICTPEIKKMGTLPDPADPADPPDPAETRHEAWCTTPGTLAPEVRMTVVLNKLPQIIWTLSAVILPSTGADLQVGWDSLSRLCPKSISNVITRDILGTQFVAVGHIWVSKLISVAANSLERGIQSRTQQKVSIYDTFGVLLEMLGKAPVSTRAHFSRK